MDLIAALRSFLRVAETGSFSAVAAELRVTQPAISRHVTALVGPRIAHTAVIVAGAVASRGVEKIDSEIERAANGGD